MSLYVSICIFLIDVAFITLKNNLVALLETLYTWISVLDSWNRFFFIKREEITNLCSKQQVSEKAKEVEKKLPVLKHQQARWKSNPESFFVNRFWGLRQDGVAVDIKKKKVFVLEFKWSTDRVERFLGMKEAAVNEQHSSIIEVLRAVADGWVVEQIHFVAGNHWSVMEIFF